MKYIFAVLSFLCLAHGSQAQGRLKNYADSITLRPSLVLANDTVVADIDIVMMNRNTYMVYEMTKENNLTYQQFEKKYDTLVKRREKYLLDKIRRDTLAFNRLVAHYDSLSKQSENIAYEASFRAAKVHSNLDSVGVLLDQTKAELKSTQTELKQQKLRNVLGQLSWGLGGAGVGIAGASILFIAIKK